MKKVLGLVIGLAATTALVAPASAAVIYAGATSSTGLDTGTGQNPLAAGFDTGTTAALTTALNSSLGYTESNLTFKGADATVNQILNGTSNIGAEPFNDTTNYLSVLGGGSVKVTINGPAANQLTFYWGSIDTYNTITFSDGTSFTGSNITPKIPSGCQTSPDCAGLVTFQDPGGTFTSFTLTSSQNSFEADNFLATDATIGNGVPETSTWVMMILGFFSIGLLGYRRKSDMPMRFA